MTSKTSKRGSILVVFDDPPANIGGGYDEILAPDKLSKFIGPGSIYEASFFAEELSRLTLPDGSRLAKSFTYKGYELWWMYYNNLFLYFCLPYTRYRRLLDYLKNFQKVSFYRLPHRNLFSYYLGAHGCNIEIIAEPGVKSPSFLPLGVFIQIIVTLLSLPVLMLLRRRIMLFVGDKFEMRQDYDFRMKFIYQELRQRKIPFVEFIRSLESWKAVLRHVFIRKRPVVYSEAVAFVGRFISIISGGRRHTRQKFGPHVFTSVTGPEARFKLLVARQHLLNVYDDIWAIRIMKLILLATGVRAAYITATLERNFHAFLGCKLSAIPTVGILHGVASRYYNGYDFLPGFDGEKMLSVDKYGLWSEWWKEYYSKYSKAYRPEQLYVSGPMRPLEKSIKADSNTDSRDLTSNSRPIKVLFISEQLAAPEEVLPYLEALMEDKGISVHITFRPYRDGFEDWLQEHYPETLNKFGEEGRIIRTGIKDAIATCEVATGTMSTAVIEALFQHKVPILFYTRKWGDYFDLKGYGRDSYFFAENSMGLIERIKKARYIPSDALGNLRERYFGDPYKNGSKWVVDQLEDVLLKGCITK